MEWKWMDKKIWIKYIAKNNTILSNNYFTITLAFWVMLITLFFLNPTVPMMIIGWITIPLYIYLYKQKNKGIITSVTVYSYQTIFMEILFNSFKLNKDIYSNIKSLFKKKK